MARYNARHHSLSPPLSLSPSPSASFLIPRPSQRHRMTGVARGPTPRRIAARGEQREEETPEEGRGLFFFFFYLISEMYEAQRSSRVFKDATALHPSVSSFIAISSSSSSFSLCRFAPRAGLIPLPIVLTRDPLPRDGIMRVPRHGATFLWSCVDVLIPVTGAAGCVSSLLEEKRRYFWKGEVRIWGNGRRGNFKMESLRYERV